MSRQNITSPVSVLLAGVIVIILLLAGSGSSTSAIVRQQNSTPTWTPCVNDDSDEFYNCLEVQDDATATAEALTETAAGYPAATATSSAYPAGSPTGGATGTATVTTTAGSLTPTTSSPTTQIARTPTPTLTQAPDVAENTAAAQAADTAEVTPTPVDAIACNPNVPVIIEGSGPPRAPVLLYFAERPVGGGSIGPDGHFALKLIVGQERAGEYRVTVRIRGTSQVLRQVTCSVPYVAPTPLPSGRQR